MADLTENREMYTLHLYSTPMDRETPSKFHKDVQY